MDDGDRRPIGSTPAAFPILTPRLSPDGTRLALGANHVWAVRRNMNLLPRITQVGTAWWIARRRSRSAPPVGSRPRCRCSRPITSSSQPQGATLARTDPTAPPDGPNPTSGRFALTSPMGVGATATMAVFDLSGRRVATVRGPAGTQLVWDGKDRGGSPAAPGIYLYRMDVGRYRQEGKVVVVR